MASPHLPEIPTANTEGNPAISDETAIQSGEELQVQQPFALSIRRAFERGTGHLIYPSLAVNQVKGQRQFAEPQEAVWSRLLKVEIVINTQDPAQQALHIFLHELPDPEELLAVQQIDPRLLKFHGFPELPSELRHIIWKEALRRGRRGGKSIDLNALIHCWARCDRHFKMTSRELRGAKMPVISSVNEEARCCTREELHVVSVPGLNPAAYCPKCLNSNQGTKSTRTFCMDPLLDIFKVDLGIHHGYGSMMKASEMLGDILCHTRHLSLEGFSIGHWREQDKRSGFWGRLIDGEGAPSLKMLHLQECQCADDTLGEVKDMMQDIFEERELDLIGDMDNRGMFCLDGAPSGELRIILTAFPDYP